MLNLILTVIQVLCAVGLVAIVMLQSGKDGGLGAITGSIAWTFYRFQCKTGISARMAKLWIKAAEYLPEDWLDFVLQFDNLCRSREEQYIKAGHVESFILT